MYNCLVLLFLLAVTLFIPTNGYCDFDSDIQQGHQNIIDEAMKNPVKTLFDALYFSEPPSESKPAIRPGPTRYNSSVSSRFIQPPPFMDDESREVDINSAAISLFYLGRSPSSLLIVITDTKHFHYSWSESGDVSRANLVIWREMPDQQFTNITNKVLIKQYDSITRTLRLDKEDNDEMLFLCKNEDTGKFYISYTTNAGKNFNRKFLPDYIETSMTSHNYFRSDYLQPSDNSVKRILAGNKYYSLDGGDTWKELINRQYFPSYQGKPHKAMWVNQSMILTSTYTSDGISLLRCNVDTDKCQMLLYDIKNFVLKGNVIVTSIYHEKDKLDNRSLYTSVNLGDVWNRAQVASFKQHHKPYVYLMSGSLSFLTLLDEDEECYDLYVSDSQHVSYSLSLKCLYEEKSRVGRIGVQRLGNFPNAFVVNKIDTSTSPVTPIMFISLNNGGSWKEAIINDTACDKCLTVLEPDSGLSFDYEERSIEEFNYENKENSRDGFYHVGTMLSNSKVPGFALSYIENTEENRGFAFATVDGGQKFFALPNKESQHFAFMCSGDVLVDYGEEISVTFSFDRGHCWYNYTLGKERPSNQRSILATNSVNFKHETVELLVFAASRKYEASKGYMDTYRLTPIPKIELTSYVVDVNKMVDLVPICQSDSIHIEEDEECVLGKKYTFRRPKEGASTCKLHESDVEADHGVCACTDADFECDYGFERSDWNSDELECKPLDADQMSQLSICYHKLYEEHERFYNTTGYRKVEGDECELGRESYFASKSLYKFHLLCTDQDFFEASTDLLVDQHSEAHYGKIFGVLLLAMFLLSTSFVAIYLFKIKKYRPSFNLPSFSFPSFSSIAPSGFTFSRFQDEA